MNKLSGRTVAALVAVALTLVVAAVVVVVTVAVRNAPEHDPEITAYAHGRTVTVPPYQYCDIRIVGEEQLDLSNCRQGESVDLEVPPGYPLQLSLPSSIAEAPWLAQLVYALPNGDIVDRVISHNDYPDDALALTIDSRPLPELRLIGVELQLPVPAIDESGRETTVPHAAWSIRTA
ncbi:Protein of unknown function [Nocardia amikacinitolerans]|uniref:DUF2771 domain-containing protein n=1 Tax=Nocardia amikacinitolerans TaxID=756689 RepID=A0A285LWR7_9NOCA|nr:DUF2771 domain-containing protein [Nocardia amikacinitolerans]MCP2279942.1 Protein of unknown function (DUF2771) [Nocardia amikacinitolerans]MCP2295790.1 Protein of unknown function (DUF2771) [Nocardia amikacinitolerans]MCP2317401.1 Protein of unknown function (DUF2771) [Nocardia amikacinitolerans]SNY87771.1 Protein of unknown function [Nocardia amikacinitolerans]